MEATDREHLIFTLVQLWRNIHAMDLVLKKEIEHHKGLTDPKTSKRKEAVSPDNGLAIKMS